MNARDVVLALLAGLAATLVVGVLTTDLVAPAIEFSLFVGIPVGLLAGVAVAALALVRLGDHRPERRRLGLAIGWFGAVFVLALILATAGLRLRNSLALPVAAVVGVGAAVVVYVRSGRSSGPP